MTDRLSRADVFIFVDVIKLRHYGGEIVPG